MAVWRGRPYAEFADEEFASAEVARLEELRLCAVEEHAQAIVELGRPAEVIGSLEAAIDAEPFRERLRAVLMLALARAGRPVSKTVAERLSPSSGNRAPAGKSGALSEASTTVDLSAS